MSRPLIVAGSALGCALAFAAGFLAGRGDEGADRDAAALSAAEMDAELRAAIRNPDTLKGYFDEARLLAALDARTLSGALEAIEEEHPSDEQLRAFARAWARIDGLAAFERTQSWLPERSRAAAPVALQEWASQDPAAALFALRSLGERQEADLVAAVAVGWARSGEPGLADYISGLSERRVQQTVLNRVFQHHARASRDEEALRWADSILASPAYSSDFKRLVLERALFYGGGRDPAAAAQWVGTQIGNEYASRAARLVVADWLPTDPDAALAWMEALPAEGNPGQAFTWGYMRWLESDRAAAEAWLRATPLTPLLFGAASRYARRLAAESPDAALAWCEGIADAKEREECLVGVGAVWYRSDPKAASDWLAQSGLPDGARQRIVQSRAPRGTAARGRLPGGMRPRVGNPR